VTEVLLSFSPADEKRVEPIRQGLFVLGLAVGSIGPLLGSIGKAIIPSLGIDHIRNTDCVVVACWTKSSVDDKIVRSEADTARTEGKLVSVELEPVNLMFLGAHSLFSANLVGWDGDYDDKRWRDFRDKVVSKIAEVEAKQGKAQAPKKALSDMSPDDLFKYTGILPTKGFQPKPDKATPAKKQKNKVFICYRRDDSAGSAGRVKDRLEKEFGADLLFMDVDAIDLGADFVKIIRAEVGKCDVLLAVIGPNWLTLPDEDGNRKVDDPDDFVRLEIGTALQRDIPVIPLLLDGAKMPKAKQLPDDLKALAVRNALEVRHNSFHADMDRLVSQLKRE